MIKLLFNLIVLSLLVTFDTVVLSEELLTRTTRSLTVSDNKIRVAILGFGDLLPTTREVEDTKPNEGLPQNLADLIIEHVTKKKRYNIVEREVIRRIFNEKKFTSNEEYKQISALEKLINFNRDADSTDLSDFGKIQNAVENHEYLAHKQESANTLAADYLVLAKLTDFNSKITNQTITGSDFSLKTRISRGRLHVRIIDVNKGVIISSSTIKHEEQSPVSAASGSTEIEFFEVLSQKAATYLNDVAFPPQIISIRPVTINRGLVDGIQVNSVCKVEKSLQSVSDESSIQIGTEAKVIGEITLNNVMETFSHSQDSLEQVEIGDKVTCQTDITNDKSRSTLPTLALAAIKVNSKNLDIREGLDSFKDTLSSEIISKLSSAYNILERENFRDVYSENDIKIIFSNSPSSKINVPKVQEADYLLFISINDLTQVTQTKTIKVLNEEDTTHTLKASGAYRMVNSAQQTVSRAGTFDIEKKIDQNSANRSHSGVLSALISSKIYSDILTPDQQTKALEEPKIIPAKQEIPW